MAEINIADIRSLNGKEIDGEIQDRYKRGYAIEYDQKYYLIDGYCRASRALEHGETTFNLTIIPFWIIIIIIGVIIIKIR